MSLSNAYQAQKKINQAANSIGFRIPRISGPKCKNCGEELNTGYYGCKKCGFYDQEREEYDKNELRAKYRLNTIDYHKRQKALLDSVIENGFSNIGDYENYVNEIIKKCKNIIIAVKIFYVLMVVISFFSNTFWDGFWKSVVWGVLYYITNYLITWYFWGRPNTSDYSDFKYVRSQKKFVIFDDIFFKKVQEVEKTKDFKVLKDSTVDPIIEISCLGLK